MRYRFAYAVAALLAVMPGCLYHSYNPNGYYGPQPVVMPGQPMNGYPSNPAYPPYYQPGAPTYQQPTFSPTPTNGGGPPSSNPIDLNNPQSGGPSTYGSGSGGTTSQPYSAPTGNNNSGGVPNPGDDTNSDYNRGSNRGGLTPTTSANAPSDVSSPFSQQESRLPRSFSDDTAENVSSPFERPVLQASNDQEGDIQQVNGQSPAARPNKTYAHHPKFSWVQGKVEYDEASSTWVIMYDDNPGTSDPFGGELTIGGDLASDHLRSGDVVRVTGSLDPIQEDARGKPLFVKTKIQKF